MEKISSTYWTNLALCKKASHRNRSHPFLQDCAVMMRPAEQAFTASAAAEKECAERGVPMLGAIGGEQDVQVVAGGFRIAKLKLHGLTFLHEIAYRNTAALLVRPDEIAHEEISSFETASMLIDGNADVQCPMGIPSLRSF
jgi:hypothetical protein